ncbi:MAG: radical SAM protein [Chitinivibrionia bacterium]|nr:radical SAM protein [Chitinivibrionia bacterium]
MDLIKELKKSKLPLVLYGAAEYGKYVKLILDWHNIKIDFVAVDKEYCRPNIKFYDFDVLSIEDVLAKNVEMNVILAFIGNNEEKIEKLKKRANVKKCVIFDKQIVLRNISFYLQGAQRSEKEETEFFRNFIKSDDIYLEDEETARTLANNWNGEINKPKNLRFIENAIPVVLCANDDFVPYLAVMLQSLLDKTNTQRKYHFIIFQRDFSLKTKECLFNQTSQFPNCAIDFIDVSCAFDEIPVYTSYMNLSVDTYSRFLIPYLLDKYPKVIYLDSDMIAKADIAEIYDLDIQQFCIGAAIDPLGNAAQNKLYNPILAAGGVFANLENWSRYFNAGVLVFDTEKFREKISCADLFRFAIYYTNRYKKHFNDQDVFNLIIKDDYFVLPPEYNDMWRQYDKNGELNFVPALIDNKIRHFIISPKPWELNCKIENNPDVLSYREYAEKVELFRERGIKAALENLDIHLAEHCNLNCAYCCHCSTVAEPEFLNIERFERDLAKLSKLTDGRISNIKLLGGEPLLNPDIVRIIQITRANIPDGEIEVLTNGILLTKMKEDFWIACKNNNVSVSISQYPIKLDTDKIFEIAEKYGVKTSWFTTQRRNDRRDRFRVQKFDMSGKRDICESYNNCKCRSTFLKDGKIYPCPPLPSTIHLQKRFGVEFSISQNDFLVLDKVNNLREILNFISRPVPFCRYCVFENEFVQWKTSEMKKEEWII